MKETTDIMGMHVTVEIKDIPDNDEVGFKKVFDYLNYIDAKFSIYKESSEISKLNRGQITQPDLSTDMLEILDLAEQTKKDTKGYFDIQKSDGTLDPSGVVKGWAIWQAGLLLEREGYEHFLIDVGGDMQARVSNNQTQKWQIGIRNPFNLQEIVKVLQITNQGVATSGTYERGQHIYNPFNKQQQLTEVLSITVIGPNIYEADRFATAAFAMGKSGIDFIQSVNGLEAYMIDNQGIATMTTGLEQFVANDNS